jgi:hypothetical protein
MIKQVCFVCDLNNTVSLQTFIDWIDTLTKPKMAHKRTKAPYVTNIVYLLHISATCGHSQGSALQRIYHKNLWTKAYILDTKLDYLKFINTHHPSLHTHTKRGNYIEPTPPFGLTKCVNLVSFICAFVQKFLYNVLRNTRPWEWRQEWSKHVGGTLCV